MFNRNTTIITLLASLLCSNAGAQPLDIDYRVSGYESLRPKLVFNDGNDTFIEGDESLRVLGLPYDRQGPYLVVKGIQERIVLEGRGMRKISIIYTGSAVTPAMLVRQTNAPKPKCDPSEIITIRIELLYGPLNITPGSLLQKTLQQNIAEINRSALTQIFIAANGDGLGEKRGKSLREYMLKNNVPASKFSILVADDPTGQSYMLIGNSSCNTAPARQSSPTVYPTPLNQPRVETVFAPTSGKKFGKGDVDTILQLLSDDKISEETASSMIANINLAQRGTQLERLYSKKLGNESQKEIKDVSKIAGKAKAVETEPQPAATAPNDLSAKEIDIVEKPITGKFTVENKEPLSKQATDGTFQIGDFAKKPSAKTMAKLSRIVGEKLQTLFIVKGDGTQESKHASSIAAKSLLRLGVENVRFDRGANSKEIEILEGEMSK